MNNYLGLIKPYYFSIMTGGLRNNRRFYQFVGCVDSFLTVIILILKKSL